MLLGKSVRFAIPLQKMLSHRACAENVPKGPGDKPKETVVVADSGELKLELEVDETGKQVPLHADL
jgi:hypothetical protein